MINVIFVCLGNICRSPSGEAVMNEYIKRDNLEDKIKCDSAGTSAYHIGEPADARMQRHASRRGYNLTSLARQFIKEDFEKFDYVIAMDEDNYYNIERLDKNSEYKNKLFLMTEFCSNYENKGVPDPYFGGSSGFELVLDILEDACEGLLNHIKKEHKL